MGQIPNLDFQITVFINKFIPHNVFFDQFFSFLSFRGNWKFVWIIIAYFVAKKFLPYLLISILIALASSELILKNLFHRIRPLHANILCMGFSFPSSHAAIAFAAATVCTEFDRKRRWLYYFTAVLISLSRIYLGCHYFLDVLTGGFTGWLIAYLIIKKYLKKAVVR